MTETTVPYGPPIQAPCAIFSGDFNTGKSSLINALLRREALPVAREESLSLPTLVGRASGKEAAFAAWSTANSGVDRKTHEEFLSIRRQANNAAGYEALAARFPHVPFNHLLLIDTAGIAGETRETLEVEGLEHRDHALFVVVTDIEYWSAKHTMEFIAFHQDIFGSDLLVVANKADHLNANEVRRISDKATGRMESFGIRPAPRFYTLSARLELARSEPFSEYRQRTKREVREQCDAGFDALRVALYEFEASRAHRDGLSEFSDLFSAPLAASFIKLHGEVPA
jgi:GTP-binding protein EngB required for normal cell division